MKTSLSDALDLVSSNVKALQTLDSVPLMKAIGRICAKDIIASWAIPSYDISLRDGRYLTQQQSLKESLHVEDLKPISTGEQVPNDCAIIFENEELDEDILRVKEIEEKLPSKRYIKKKGEDIKHKELLLKKYQKIGPYDITNLASQGKAKVSVLKESRIAYLGIGDELIDVEDEFNQNKIFNSNAYTIAARGEMMGARTATIVHVKDDKNSILEKLNELSQYDAIITSGGMSRGDAMNQLLEDGTLNPLFKGVAMAPAGLTALSFLENTPILHLPGLPMSCLLGFEVMGAALISQLYGQNQRRIGVVTKTADDIKFNPKSKSIVPGFCDGRMFYPERIVAGMLNVLNRCNGFIIPSQNQVVKAGDKVKFYPFISWG